MNYFVYENWTHDRTRVHAASCGFCNDGHGMHAEDSGANGRWLGPFPSCATALAAARALNRADIGICNKCAPAQDIASRAGAARPDPNTVIAGKVRVSDRIRALGHAGYSRSEIAKLVDRTYQQVRQVLVDDERRSARGGNLGSALPGFNEEALPFEPLQGHTRTPSERLVLGKSGRLDLSPALLDILGVAAGDVCIAIPEGEGVIMLMSSDTAIRQAQAIIRRFVPPGVSLVDELLADRRAEAERESRGD